MRSGLRRACRARALLDRVLKGLEIFGETPLAAERLLQVFKKKLVIRRNSRGQPVIDAVPGTPILYQARIPQIRQMPRDIGLSRSQNVLDIATAQLAV